MNIPTAIATLEGWHENIIGDEHRQYREALMLGIEALKSTSRARDGDPPLDGELLPGETESDPEQRMIDDMNAGND